MTRVVRDNCGRSHLCPFLRGESAGDRHRRRHKTAMANLTSVRAWCEWRGIELTVASFVRPRDLLVCEGWKWTFRAPGKFAQWRPFAGKLNLKTRLTSETVYTIKTYDTDQLLEILERWRTSTGDTLKGG